MTQEEAGLPHQDHVDHKNVGGVLSDEVDHGKIVGKGKNRVKVRCCRNITGYQLENGVCVPKGCVNKIKEYDSLMCKTCHDIHTVAARGGPIQLDDHTVCNNHPSKAKEFYEEAHNTYHEEWKNSDNKDTEQDIVYRFVQAMSEHEHGIVFAHEINRNYYKATDKEIYDKILNRFRNMKKKNKRELFIILSIFEGNVSSNHCFSQLI